MKRSTSRSSSPTSKSSRTTTKFGSAPILCTFPPTCSSKPTALASTRELEAHYAKYHAWVCQAERCSNVFPDERILELHQTECHDPIADVKKERGERIFACFLPSSVCSKVFMTPKARRLHLIAAHGYPKEYFFAVVNKGIGGLLAKWGDGAGMIRGQWKQREMGGNHDEEGTVKGAGDGDGDDDTPEETDGDSKSDSESEEEPEAERRDSSIDALTTSFQNTLSLSPVPNSIQFGRGAKRGARGRGRGRGYYNSFQDRDDSFESPANMGHIPGRGRGAFRGNRGRGSRGRGNVFGEMLG